MNSEDIARLYASMSLKDAEGPVKHGVEIEVVKVNIFIFHFKDQSDRRRVWAVGLWTFDDNLIVLEEPTGKGEVEKRAFNRVEFWVQIHHVPLLCLSKEVGRFLGSG
ncbi:hypothetical protein Dsin_001550 [Dipteronia sinensis]|uniref:DUF4283 domain-containing protein n=1 Tax=Dipteronia sinensis TaxID=43782 RepID=A0AAE0B5U6_9ROSI|nr:hypothetical protein Dsin_001550 [Dipteronia sinensis]